MATKSSGASEPITFVVPGQLIATRGKVAAHAGGGAGAVGDRDAGRVKASVRVGALRSGAAPTRVTAVPGQDIVRLRIQDGPTLKLHPHTARDLLEAIAP